MRQYVKKGLSYATIGFAVLFGLRLLYGFIAYPNGKDYSNQNYLPTSSFEFSKNNYASTKWQRKGGGKAAVSTGSAAVDQKYAKVASMSSATNQFEEDEKKIRQKIKEYNALIQFEQNSGLQENRYLHLAIGIDPSKFEEFTPELKKIGKLTSIRIDKIDKTSEFKDLKAKRSSLEKIRENLIGLKGQEGKIEELINLENRILDIEQQIQNLGVSLGEFDEENEFCTVKFSLLETKINNNIIPISSRLKTAFEWTIKYYLMLAWLIFIVIFSSMCLSVTVKVAKPIVEHYWKKFSEQGNRD